MFTRNKQIEKVKKLNHRSELRKERLKRIFGWPCHGDFDGDCLNIETFCKERGVTYLGMDFKFNPLSAPNPKPETNCFEDFEKHLSNKGD